MNGLLLLTPCAGECGEQRPRVGRRRGRVGHQRLPAGLRGGRSIRWWRGTVFGGDRWKTAGVLVVVVMTWHCFRWKMAVVLILLVMTWHCFLLLSIKSGGCFDSNSDDVALFFIIISIEKLRFYWFQFLTLLFLLHFF